MGATYKLPCVSDMTPELDESDLAYQVLELNSISNRAYTAFMEGDREKAAALIAEARELLGEEE